MNLDKYPLVSFIIPFYNHNHFVKQTLDSMIEDTYLNKEIIIINDGSSNPDDSSIVNWIKEYKDEVDINYIKRENKGLTKTLNELISLSKGKYIVVCASDDYLINNTVTKRVEILENNPNKLLLLSDAIVIDDDNNKLYDSSLFELYNTDKNKYLNNDLKDAIINNWSVCGATHLIRKDLYELIGLYDETLTVEDWDFFLRAVSKDIILFYDEKVSAYRKHATNSSLDSSKELRFYHDFYHVALKNSKLFDEPYKSTLLKTAKQYKKVIKRYPWKIFRRRIKFKTRAFRYKVKALFKKGK